MALHWSPSVSATVRLRPGQDLQKSLQEIFLANNLRGASIVACVGSLRRLNIRLADSNSYLVRDEKFEIVSLSGTIARVRGTDEADDHLHISVADGQGNVLGGHLMEGNLIYTTAEITLLVPTELVFERTPDETTGYLELEVNKRA